MKNTVLLLLRALCAVVALMPGLSVAVATAASASELGAPYVLAEEQQETAGKGNTMIEVVDDEMFSTGSGNNPLLSSSKPDTTTTTTSAVDHDHDRRRRRKLNNNNKRSTSSCIARRKCTTERDQARFNCIIQRLCGLKRQNPTLKARKECNLECIRKGKVAFNRCAKPCSSSTTSTTTKKKTSKVNKKKKKKVTKRNNKACVNRRSTCKTTRERAKATCIIQSLCGLKKKYPTTKARETCRLECFQKGKVAFNRCAGPCATATTSTTKKMKKKVHKKKKATTKKKKQTKVNKRKKTCLKKKNCKKKKSKAKASCVKKRGCKSKPTRTGKKQCIGNCANKGKSTYNKCARKCKKTKKKKQSKVNRKKSCLRRKKCNTKKNKAKASCMKKRGCKSKTTRAKKKQCKANCDNKGKRAYARCARKCTKKKNQRANTATATPTRLTDPMVSLEWDENNSATIEFCQEEGNQTTTFGYRLPGDTYCGPAGLVIRVTPGTDYQLTVHNTANETTNVHAHGLHISGDGNANDVTRVIDPGMCLTYYWNIPADHMGGTHWVHSNMIGSALDQVTGGAFAMLIVEEDKSALLENVSKQNDRRNIVAWLDNNELLLAAYKAGSAFTSNGNTDNVTSLDMIAGEWYRLRLLTIDDDGGRVPVSITSESTECDVHVVAWDGVWRFGGPNTDIERSIQPTGSGRTDLAVRCSTSGQYNITAGDNSDQVATLNVVNGTTTRAKPFVNNGASWEPGRPNYLLDLANGNFTSLNDTLFNQYTIELSGGGDEGSPLTINSQQWNETTAIDTLEYDSLQKWLIEGSGPHPFHLHTYHMQAFNCDGHEDGQYYDSVTSSNDDDCTVLFHIIDYSGRTVAQGQNLRHLDEGMIVWFDVQGTDAPVQSTEDRDQKTC